MAYHEQKDQINKEGAKAPFLFAYGQSGWILPWLQNSFMSSVKTGKAIDVSTICTNNINETPTAKDNQSSLDFDMKIN